MSEAPVVRLPVIVVPLTDKYGLNLEDYVPSLWPTQDFLYGVFWYNRKRRAYVPLAKRHYDTFADAEAAATRKLRSMQK